MKPSNPEAAEADKFIDKRKKVHEIGGLRREKMIVMRVGERRVSEVFKPVAVVEVGSDSGRFDKTETSARGILDWVLADYRGKVAVSLWNGARVAGDADAPCNVVFRHPAVLQKLVLHWDMVSLAVFYLAGDMEVEGDMESLFDLVEYHTIWRKKSWHQKIVCFK